MKTRGYLKKGHRKKKSKLFMLTGVFVVLFVGYLCSRLFLNSYNSQLTATNQDLTSQISEAQSEIDDLQIEINLLQEKTRVLGMLDYQVRDNQNNIYVIDNN